MASSSALNLACAAAGDGCSPAKLPRRALKSSRRCFSCSAGLLVYSLRSAATEMWPTMSRNARKRALMPCGIVVSAASEAPMSCEFSPTHHGRSCATSAPCGRSSSAAGEPGQASAAADTFRGNTGHSVGTGGPTNELSITSASGGTSRSDCRGHGAVNAVGFGGTALLLGVSLSYPPWQPARMHAQQTTRQPFGSGFTRGGRQRGENEAPNPPSCPDRVSPALSSSRFSAAPFFAQTQLAGRAPKFSDSMVKIPPK